MSSFNAGDFIDLKKYPIDIANSSVRDELVKQCSVSLNGRGICFLPNFFNEEALKSITTELGSTPPSISDKFHTAYQSPVDTKQFPPEHPRNQLLHAKIGFINRARVGTVAQLYEWSPLLKFFSDMIGRELFLSEDTNGSVYATVNSKDFITAWHFDQHPYSCVFLIQPPETGGEFQWLHNARPTEEEGYSNVGKILAGERIYDSVSSPRGSLVFFKGLDALHQVSTVQGEVSRISVVFAYATVPHFGNSALVAAQNNWAEPPGSS